MRLVWVASTFLTMIASANAEQAPASPLARLYASNFAVSPYARIFDIGAFGPDARSVQVSLIVGDIEQVLGPGPHPDAVVMPTNTEADLQAPFPLTQRVMMSRISSIARTELQKAVARRRDERGGDASIMAMAIDGLAVKIQKSEIDKDEAPDKICLIATDFPQGGSIARRDFFQQDKIEAGLARCLTDFSTLGAKLAATPLIGSASFATGNASSIKQRLLLQCRLINAVSGASRGVSLLHNLDLSLTEITIIVWRFDLEKLFGRVPTGAKLAEFNLFSSRMRAAFQRGLKGQRTTVEDVGMADCLTIFGDK